MIRQTTAARLLGVSPITLYRWQKRGIITPVKTARPGRWYDESDVAALRVDGSHVVEHETPAECPTSGR